MIQLTCKSTALILTLAMAAFPQAPTQQTAPPQTPSAQTGPSQTAPAQTAPNPNDEREQDRLQHAGKVLGEILNGPYVGLQFALDRAECVIVLPGVIKGSGNLFTLFWGGSFGRGAMTCRSGPHFDGPWGAPTMVALEGVSWGLEAGGESVDILITVMNPDGANSILTSKVKLGGNASAAAGPVGRDTAAEEDVILHSEMLTFARAKGVFAGAALTGSTLRADGPANTKLYGHHVNAKDVVLHGAEKPPDAAKLLLDTLNQRSPKNLSAAKNR
ncbi:MAG: lipid-binding SYLF domain-containing protein [Candidatus Acidiferrales bacterium]